MPPEWLTPTVLIGLGGLALTGLGMLVRGLYRVYRDMRAEIDQLHQDHTDCEHARLQLEKRVAKLERLLEDRGITVPEDHIHAPRRRRLPI